jgi:diketogulonate reductase-like aldo/keto reductase
MRRLRNGFKIPLVGFGVGNQDHALIPGVLEYADRRSTDNAMPLALVDTAMKSANAHLLARSTRVASGATMVLTKVWYTHLGYERTKLAVEDELMKYGRPKLDIVLLHWPRCNPMIPWMDCEAEEAALPQRVRDAGPAGSFIASWRALEDLYDEGKIKAIGVSNFKERDLRMLLSIPGLRTKPHMVQGALWSAIFDPELMALLRREGIFYQAYGVVSGTVGKAEPREDAAKRTRWARARRMLRRIADARSDGAAAVSVAQVIQRWLVQRGIGIVPRATTATHFDANAAVRTMRALSASEMREAAVGVEQLVRSVYNLPEGSWDAERDRHEL